MTTHDVRLKLAAALLLLALDAGAAHAQTGNVTGEVRTRDGSPVAGAAVYPEGIPSEARTDASGRFTISLPPGSHRLTVIHGEFVTGVAQVEVQADRASNVRVLLTPATPEADDFLVTGAFIRGGVASLLEERRNKAVMSDAVSAEDIARMPTSNAAGAAQRVVGANIVDGRFVYVRGLGERYTNALLNGVPLPSPEPDRSTVPLDLFPAQILESLDISKTFTPDVPGDFAGGSVRIVTRKVPEKALFSVSLSSSVNSESTFVEGYGQRSGSTDLLGFDDGDRQLSSEIPTDYALVLGTEKPDGEIVLGEELEAQGLNVSSPMSVKETTNLPNISASVAAGDGWQLGNGVRLGVLGSLIYARVQSRRIESTFELDPPSSESETGELEVNTGYPDVETMNDAVRWGAFVSTALELSAAHKLTLIGMHSQLADAKTSVRSGSSLNLGADLASSRMEYVSRGLSLVQLQGNHDFAPLNAAELDWTLSLANAQRDEPDTRDIVYRLNADSGLWVYLDGTESGRHFFSDQSELSKTAALDWTQPITDGDVDTKLKTGGMVTLRDRVFEARRFALRPLRGADPETFVCGEEFDPISCPDELFAQENIGPVLRLDEGTRPTDAYNASLHVYAGYLMGEAGLGKHWRFLTGARVEATEQTIAPYDQFANEEVEEGSNALKSVDLLPAASIVFLPIDTFNVRVAVSRTLARPQLRELAPFAFSDYFGGAQNSGNPDLKLTSILNGDLRFEYFPSSREVLALSLFAKDFTDPIEPVYIPSSTTNVLTYRNALGALLFGVEVEGRKTLEFVAKALEDFTIITSLMIADSQIRVEQTGDEEFLTNTERPMVQSAPYVVNASIDYENRANTQVRLLYNITGPRLVEVGTEGLDDAYQHPQHLVDLSASQGLGDHFRLRATLQNLLNTEVLVTQGSDESSDNVRRRYREGVSASIGVSYTH